MTTNAIRPTAGAFLALLLTSACAATATGPADTSAPATPSAAQAEMSAPPLMDEKFHEDREAILAMTGDYKVKFDFIETVSYTEGYTLKDRKLSGGYEVVRVIEDTGDFISLQHILVVGGEEKFPVKHWRQDWIYEPEEVLVFIGGNAWDVRPVSEEEREGKWAQVVYQVDDSPRYGAVAAWRHDNGISQWEAPREWRPLPRRDMTTRDDYHAVNAVNRHALTPDGWVHEQDNEKTVLRGEPHVLVREIAINTYDHSTDFDVSIAMDYWAETEDYWAGVRDLWRDLEVQGQPFALTVQGESEAIYLPLLGLAEAVAADEMSVEGALEDAEAVIAEFTTTDIGTLESRLRPASDKETTD